VTKPCIDSDIDEICQRLGDAADEFSGRTIILTGGRGFLGRYFGETLTRLNASKLSSPCTLILLDNLITAGELGKQPFGDEHIKFIQHNVIEPYAFDGPVDYVVHAAGIASPFHYRAYPLQALDVAVQGSRHMLELANEKGARYTFFSSSEVYGDPDPRHIPMQESYRGNVSSQGPRACYDESKRLGETLCYIYHNTFGVPTNVIRPFNVFGPGMQETDYRVLPNFAKQIKSGKPLHVYGTGNQTRTFCYVTDAMVGFLLTILRGVPGETYNIGNPKPEVSVLQLVSHIQSIANQKLETNVTEHPDSYPADEPNRRCPDIRKAEIQLGYRPEVPLVEGLRRFLAWTDQAYSAD
jgi:UDP-glucuronate decarboxylase